MADETIEIDSGLNSLRQRLRLEIISGPHLGDAWEFDQSGEFVIGRSHQSQIRLTNETALSGQHFRLEIAETRVRISDLQSRNGTWLNGVRVSSATIVPGDSFGVGDTRMIVQFSESPSNKTIIEMEQTVAMAQICLSPERFASSQLSLKAETNEAIIKTMLGSEDTLACASGETAEVSSAQSESIGVYKVIREIGAGGMATVFEVQHKRSGERFAMKLIRSNGDVSEKHLALFVREAGLILKLVHPRIVRAYEFGFHGSMPFLIMELLPLIDILAVVSTQNPLQRIKTSCWVVSRLLQALQFAHDQGVVHRDVKLGNILAYRNGKRLQVKLGDFGLAKSYEDAGLSAMTNEQSIRGTLSYMAPEQLEDSRAAGPLVDLFSSGVCLYGLLTGTLPSAAFSQGQFEQELSRLSILPAPLVDILRRSMQHDPSKRFQSAVDMEKAIQVFHGK